MLKNIYLFLILFIKKFIFNIEYNTLVQWVNFINGNWQEVAIVCRHITVPPEHVKFIEILGLYF